MSSSGKNLETSLSSCEIILSIASKIGTEATVSGTLGELGIISILSGTTSEDCIIGKKEAETEADDDDDDDDDKEEEEEEEEEDDDDDTSTTTIENIWRRNVLHNRNIVFRV